MSSGLSAWETSLEFPLLAYQLRLSNPSRRSLSSELAIRGAGSFYFVSVCSCQEIMLPPDVIATTSY
jgi:hypothetical protein